MQKKHAESLNKFIDSYHSLLQNFGAIAGLVISVFYPQQFISVDSIAPPAKTLLVVQ